LELQQATNTDQPKKRAKGKARRSKGAKARTPKAKQPPQERAASAGVGDSARVQERSTVVASPERMGPAKEEQEGVAQSVA
jgi:hypothetical protein